MTEFTHDMSGMFAIHDAFRRDLARMMQSNARSEGWDLFETMLLMHHEIEDEMLWPPARDNATGSSADLDLLDRMTSEHAAIRPLLDRLDHALARAHEAATESARSDLRCHVLEHLSHEEHEALPLLDRTLSEEQWRAFDQASVARMAPHMHRYVPWLLDGADDRRTTQFLTLAPRDMRTAYLEDWLPAYRAANLWAAVPRPAVAGSPAAT
jgi:hypothetical protein